jgi:hypothetical protein
MRWKILGLVGLIPVLGCVGALQGGTVGGATYEWARVNVAVFDQARAAVGGLPVLIDGQPTTTDAAGRAGSDITWKWSKQNPTDSTGRDYHDVIVAAGGTSKTVRLHPAETVAVVLDVRR